MRKGWQADPSKISEKFDIIVNLYSYDKKKYTYNNFIKKLWAFVGYYNLGQSLFSRNPFNTFMY